MRKIYRIRLSPEERAQLEAVTHKKVVDGRKVIKARALLLCDESEAGPGMKDPEIIEATGMKSATLSRLRERCCEVGPLEALDRAKQAKPSRISKVTGHVEAHLTALACSEAPEGCKRWTLNLLGNRLVELKLVDSISYETVRRALKKTNSSPG